MARRMATALSMPPVKMSVTNLGGGISKQGVSFPGGLDQTTPSLRLQPGSVVNGANFECTQTGGYGRIKGYERYDGRPSPSAAVYQIVQINAFSNVPSVGQTLTQATSGATGVIVAVNNVVSAPFVVITKVTGAFDYTHNVSVGATLIGTAVSPSIAVTPLQNAQYLAAAADNYRADIQAVPGAGAILGVVAMQFGSTDFVYAFRNNVSNTAVNLYVNSSSGWTQVPFFNTVSFTAGGTATPQDGDTLTQGGVHATIKRVVWQSGAWTGSAVGQFVVTNPTGGNFAAGAATTSSGAAVTLSGAQTAITLQPNGKFQFIKANFSGGVITRRIYGCDGVNKAFEFDGTTLAPITTGLSTDAPSNIAFHRDYLLLSYQSSLLYSGPGTPFKWDSIDGGGEIACGDVLTGMISVPGSQTSPTCSLYMKTNTAFLYGTDATTWSLVTFNTNIGALQYSLQNLYDTFFFDMLGAVNMRTTLNWGNFLPTALNKNILPFVSQERTKLVASSLLRSKSQYRVFFSDGAGLYITMVNQEYLGALPVQFPNPVYSIDNEITSNDNEVTYFGSNDGNGYIYQLDVGTGFDGAALPAFITLAWDALKSPRVIKRFRRAAIEIQGSTYVTINFGYQLGYGTPNVAVPANVNYPSNFSAPYWDAFTWDNFTWDGQSLNPTTVDMTGSEENVQVTLTSSTNYIDAYQVNSIIYQYSERRQKRN